MAVRINRGDPRRAPFFSNLVTGRAEQITPNGCAYGGDDPKPPASFGIVGAEPGMMPWSPDAWPGGNRSGE